MPDTLNVFEHQRFRLRTPSGERVAKSFREILTEPDAAYALDYAQAFYDVAALNLMSYLAQVAFGPRDAAELSRRIAAPMTEAEFEERVASLRARFALTGDGPRFMQGPDQTKATGAEHVGRAILSTHEIPNKTQDDKRFLNRLDQDWGIPIDQSALFLFTRNTFYPGMLGGHKKGTNGSNPVRVLVTDPAEGNSLWVRRTLWLNVLARDTQREFAGSFADPKALRNDDYSGLFWIDPPQRDVPVGSITLQAALGWMSDYYWLPFTEERDFVCPLTGAVSSGLAARTMKRTSTRIGYGDESDSNFRHPNVPTETQFKDGDKIGERPFSVRRTEGLAKAVGAAFFGGRTDRRNARYTLAPVVSQLVTDPIQNLGLSTRLLVFGFHMLSAQKNVHGGIEQSTFDFRPTAPDTPEGLQVLDLGAEAMYRATDFVVEAAKALRQAVRRAHSIDCDLAIKDDGSIQHLLDKRKNLRDESNPDKNPGSVPYGRDVLAALWRDAEARLAEHAGRIAEAGADGPAGLSARTTALQAAWEVETISTVKLLFEPVFSYYGTLPRTMPYAHKAKEALYKKLGSLRSTAPEAHPVQ